MSEYLDPKTTKLILDTLYNTDSDDENSDFDNAEPNGVLNNNRNVVFEKISEFIDDSGSEWEFVDDEDADPDLEVTFTTDNLSYDSDSDSSDNLCFDPSIPSTSGLQQSTNKPKHYLKSEDPFIKKNKVKGTGVKPADLQADIFPKEFLRLIRRSIQQECVKVHCQSRCETDEIGLPVVREEQLVGERDIAFVGRAKGIVGTSPLPRRNKKVKFLTDPS
ncbi:hypothetical protein J6590_058889 [Homalodisca vitripennis]|nr:hypothetical protein J6590_058889 [Homalodisca vitripennis]